jgi:hypothetical protein
MGRPMDPRLSEDKLRVAAVRWEPRLSRDPGHLKVRDFLRHASVQTTQQWYAYLLEDAPSIGMNDFVPTLASVRS